MIEDPQVKDKYFFSVTLGRKAMIKSFREDDLGIILSTKRTESFIVVFQATFIKHLCLLGQCPREACDGQLPEFLSPRSYSQMEGK